MLPLADEMLFVLIKLPYKYLVYPCKNQSNNRYRALNKLLLIIWQYNFIGREWEPTSKFSCFACASAQLERISTVAKLGMQALYQADVSTCSTRRKDRIILFLEQWQEDTVEGEATEPATSDQIHLSLHLHPWSSCFLFSWLIFVKIQLPLGKSWWHKQL